MKIGNTYKATIAGCSNVPTVTHTYITVSDSYVHITAYDYLLRMGFTTNVYPIGDDAYKSMVLTEQKLGTYFIS